MDDSTQTYKLSELYPDVAAKAAQRLHVKKDEIPFVRKYFVADKDSVQVDAQERSVVARISCVNVDRDGESLRPEGVVLDNYKSNPIVCWGHSYDMPSKIVGKNIWIKADEKGLIAKTAFANNEFADQVYRAYTEDVGGTGPLLRGWSVGFIPMEYETPTKGSKDGPRRIYTKWELLEYSAVPIPCSPESLTLAYAKGIITRETLGDDFDEPDPEPEAKSEVVLKPETTDNYHRIPVDDSDHSGHKIRTIDVTDGVKALYCITDKKIITYLFDVNSFTMAEARAWVEAHKKRVITHETTNSEDDEIAFGASLLSDEWVIVSPGIEKTFDLKGNPSVSDISCALWKALNPPPIDDKVPAYWEMIDLYPHDYPNGVCVAGMVEDGLFTMYQYKYRYANSVATLSGEPTPVATGYVRRGIDPTAAIRDLALQQNTLIKRIDDLWDNMEGKVLATAIIEALPEEEPAPESMPEPVPEAKSVISVTSTPEPVKSDTEVIADYLKSTEFREYMRLEIDKAIGRVR
jgi:hypothetical protein